MAVVVLIILSLSGMAERLPGAHSTRLLQSAHDTFYGGSDAFSSIEKVKLEDDAKYSLTPTTVSVPAPINHDKKENKQALEDNPKLLYSCGYPCCGINYHDPCNKCCPRDVKHTPQPTTHVKEAGNGGADKKENRQTLEDNPKLLYSCGYPCCGVYYHGPCNRCCPKGVQHIHTPPPSTHVKEAGNGGGDKKENRQALEDNPKLLFSCGYPCCGVYYHGPCNRCCPKGVQHIRTPPPTTHVKEAGNGSGHGHGGGDGHN